MVTVWRNKVENRFEDKNTDENFADKNHTLENRHFLNPLSDVKNLRQTNKNSYRNLWF